MASKPTLAERKKRLFALRLRINQSRKANRDVVVQEANKLRLGNPKKRRRKVDYEYIVETWKKSLSVAGVTDETKYYCVETANDAHRKLSAKQQKAYRANNNFGWNQFNEDQMYKGHEKRIKAAFGEKTKKRKGDIVEQGTERSAGADGLSRMSSELKERKLVRARFSRRRQVYEEEDVNYINERNRGFNKKLERAYDKYTVETRQNLERGTALD